ncbi:btaf1 RNA polymerase II, B-TFIID transcription factor-associated, 170kDa [Phytophthora boehmeriae]|uniref:Btaf1 RNA polymerase II, B-TFIID transcription factor-associated, 170kDa n=1 Tax=Phytophthora boehmeriae TaxID=109152 RepID=A0A8T1X081_9STRA|nr:btaf1 RNA polymerase II, B-TFIID transcription factor-associated, 170kDa [Phytophthora boehmeriae]
MGLGKTLQTLSAIAATLQTAELVGSKQKLMPCLVVCPPIVVHHWIMEAQKYLPEFFGSIVDYSLPASDRKTLRCDGGIPLCGDRPTLIVTTYSILRSDIEHLSTIDYSFVVLDEAHLIRNPSTALFRAVLELHASHRVALSGTPLQNNVTDLWALFEFLMPGYLGDFALFRREFVLPITKSKERNATAKQKELAAIAITQLHQKVLPFILRRTKDQVLSELPPKIISNVLLPLSPLQKRLYSLASSTENEANNPASDKRSLTVHDTKQITNVFTNLQLLRKICVHPALVVDTAVAHKLSANEKRALDDWKSSGKMTGLRDLLVECCDIAAGDQSNNDGRAADTINADDCNISPHRCLVFAHLQKTLDLTEQMLCDALPRVTYRRLDGQTPHSKRQDIVQNFNADPSIDVLLLTTSVGGLGLTLTGADTVIFVEHSWNPFVDLQAMDRAHRIGQKRTVRVFRLIMEESLEEHILNLQEFKEKVAATVVKKNDARSSMNANTKGVLKLLQTSSSAVAAKEIRAMIGTKKANEADQQMAPVLPQGAQELLDQLGELWDESQYESLAFPEQTE